MYTFGKLEVAYRHRANDMQILQNSELIFWHQHDGKTRLQGCGGSIHAINRKNKQPVRGVNESPHASFLSSPQEKWYLFGNRVSSFTLMRKAVGHCTFYTKHLLHQTPFTPGTFYTRHLLHQAPFTPNNTVYTRHLFTRHISHQTPFTPDNFHSRQLLHQPTFTPVVYFYTNQLLHQTPFTPPNFHTCLILLHQPAFTPDTFYTNQLLHETPFTPTSFYTRHLLHQRHLSHQTPFTPDTFDKRQLFTPQILLHQTPFTPDASYTKHPLHSPTFTPHLSHQTSFTSSTFYTTPGRQTRVDSSLWPQRTVPKLPSGTNGCQTLETGTLNTIYFCQKRPLCQPPLLPHTPSLFSLRSQGETTPSLPAGFRNKVIVKCSNLHKR